MSQVVSLHFIPAYLLIIHGTDFLVTVNLLVQMARGDNFRLFPAGPKLCFALLFYFFGFLVKNRVDDLLLGFHTQVLSRIEVHGLDRLGIYFLQFIHPATYLNDDIAILAMVLVLLP